MFRTFAFLSLFAFVSHSHAITSTEQWSSMTSRAPRYCEFLNSETASWKVKTENQKEEMVVPAGQVPKATDYVRVCHILTVPFTDETYKVFNEAATEDLAKAMGNGFSLFASQCSLKCGQIGESLIKSVAKEKPAIKTAAKAELMKFLKTSRYPTFSTANQMIRLIDSGLQAKLWKLNKAQTANYEKLKAEEKKAFEAQMAKYDQPPATSEEDIEKQPKDSKMPQIFKDDVVNSKPYLDDLSKIVQALK